MGDLFATIRAALCPIHREGWRYIAIFAAVTVVLGLLWEPLWIPGLILTAWCAYFFRDPPRVTPIRPGLIVSPADGVVTATAPARPPVELGLGDAPLARVTVFMNVLDVHVNRMPVAGLVERIAYRPGTFVNAALDKASEENERSGMTVRMDDGRAIGVVQIAGLVARRILCQVGEGQVLKTGERFGLIRFGSRLDVYLPPGVSPLVAVGQRAVAGETVLADLMADEPPRLGAVR
ncbi:phosphatidylserine decarboxylase [Zavarzinia sp. CC-PAN008]|uniref:phosphatidylserine decarboxylase n=1 Tax=Zavarzinia sp. CC-PAN008 TaxID=3243332 RepID=UPI003F74789E